MKDLINDLESQDYQKELLEVILIDDHSDDETFQIAEAAIANSKIFRIISLPAGISGKKKALKTGIEDSIGNLILTTDADCRFTKNWVKTMVKYFYNYPGHLLVGPVFLKEEKGFFNHFQSLEFLSLIASGAGAIGIGHPIMCNGANLGGNRSLFQKAGSIYNSSIASGDDIFLLLELKKHNSPVVFVKDNDAVVITNNQKSFGNYLSQRSRWTFKSRFYKDYDIISVAVIVLLTNLFLVSGLFYLPFSTSFADDYLLIYSIKSFADYILLYYVAKFF
ncbi:MAG: glycosyltransferase [Bacteroidales bacterium]|nr:glycosyltransferase [Bacteroidales bacterium]